MISFISKSVTKIFGTKSERDIKALMPIVENIKNAYANLSSLSDDELRGKTAEFKSRIATFLSDIDNQITSLHTSAEETEDVDAKDRFFQQIDALQLERNSRLEVVLLSLIHI
jgi:preprotein translocase subunit SecA